MASQVRLYVPSYMRCRFADVFTCFAGELPKELGDLVNLTHFDAGTNKFQGESYAPSYIHTLGHAHNGVVCVCEQ